MNKIEGNVIRFAEKNRAVLFFGIISLLAFYIRFAGFDYVSGDMSAFLIPWFNQIRDGGGIVSLKSQIGNYNILYQTLIAFLTYFKIDCVWLYKLLSVVFDYLLAFFAADFVGEMCGFKRFTFKHNLVYTVILMLPTVFLNSGFWGQCDSIYCFFLLMTLYRFYKEKYISAFVFFGLALGCKFQAAFLAPFIVIYYFYKKRFTILGFFLSFTVFLSTGIFGYIFGRSLVEPIQIYLTQSGTYKDMYKNVYSFWCLVAKQGETNWEYLHTAAMVLTLTICGLALYTVMSGIIKINTAEKFLGVAAWSFWALVYFLPEMHERYTYMVDILLVLLTFVSRKYLKYALLSCTLSTMTYGRYLFGMGTFEIWFSALYLAAFVWFAYEFLRDNSERKKVCVNAAGGEESSQNQKEPSEALFAKDDEKVGIFHVTDEN